MGTFLIFIRKLEVLSIGSYSPIKFLKYKRSSFSLSDLVNYNAKIPQKITGFPFQIVLLSTINILFKSRSGLNLYSFSTMQSNYYVYCPRGELVLRNETLVKLFCTQLQIQYMEK